MKKLFIYLLIIFLSSCQFYSNQSNSTSTVPKIISAEVFLLNVFVNDVNLSTKSFMVDAINAINLCKGIPKNYDYWSYNEEKSSETLCVLKSSPEYTSKWGEWEIQAEFNNNKWENVAYNACGNGFTLKDKQCYSNEELTNQITDTVNLIDHFAIEFPDKAEAKSDNNYLTIIAKDKNDNAIKSYEGKIIIKVNDPNATIPNEGEYTFIAQDQGIKQFAIAMVFSEIGEKTITVYAYENDKINYEIKGTKNVSVTKSTEGESSMIGGEIREIKIKSPIKDTEYLVKDVLISGIAIANSNLKLMLDEAKVAEIPVDADGFFSYLAKNLTNGLHSVYVIEMEGLRRSSESMSFSVNTSTEVAN